VHLYWTLAKLSLQANSMPSGMSTLAGFKLESRRTGEEDRSSRTGCLSRSRGLGNRTVCGRAACHSERRLFRWMMQTVRSVWNCG
jgi:hypothetical protein